MRSHEIPPRDDKDVLTADVETFEDDREIPESVTNEAQINDILERAAESPTGLTEEDKEKIKELKRSISHKLIEQALESKDDGTEAFEDARESEEKQQPMQERPAKKVTGLRRLGMALGFLFAGLSGQAAETQEKNPEDSTGEKPKQEQLTTAENSAEVSDQLREDWNEYVDWLEEQGLKGSESLDHNDLGGSMIDQYKKEHPETSVSRETVDDIQKEFAKYREWVISEIRAGRGQFAPGTNEKNFMDNLSKIDNIPGHLTTSVKFPKEYLATLNNTVDYAARGNNAIKDIEGSFDERYKKTGKVDKLEGGNFAKAKQQEKNNNVVSRMKDMAKK